MRRHTKQYMRNFQAIEYCVVKKDLFEEELLKSTIEYREPITLGFFHSSIRQTSNVGVVLQLLPQVLLWE